MAFSIMGVINVTPDSFSDGGAYLQPEAALNKIEAMLEEGADWIDIGAESSRPGSQPISPEEEWARLAPVMGMVDKMDAKFSLDTCKPETMRRALNHNISMINNIRGLCDPETLAQLARRQGLHYMYMHMAGSPQSMQEQPLKAESAVEDVERGFHKAHEALTEAGFESDRQWFDPGIGFGKDDGANLRLIAKVKDWSTRRKIAVGVSRKSLFGRLLGINDPLLRDPPSKMLELAAVMLGAAMIRTHEVATLARLRAVLDA